MDVRSLYPDAKDDFWYISGYQPMIDAMGKVLVQRDNGSYQGDTRVLLEKDGKFGYLCFGWGSCSGCDALQACRCWGDVQELFDVMESRIKWFDSTFKALKWFREHDWVGDYDRDEAFIRECTTLLEGLLDKGCYSDGQHSDGQLSDGQLSDGQLRLYVWEDVLRDYTPGIVCVLAVSEDQARRLVKAEDELASRRIEWLSPKVVETPEAFVVWGGG